MTTELVAVSDTHGRDDPGLTPHLRETIERSELLIHAGDFVTETVYDRLGELADRLVAVAGNSDSRSLGHRLPETKTVTWQDTRFLVAHGHRHDPTSLSFLARQERADVIVTGHTHRPTIDRLDGTLLINPGSHAQPRGNRKAYAAFERKGGKLHVELRAPTGGVIQSGRV